MFKSISFFLLVAVLIVTSSCHRGNLRIVVNGENEHMEIRRSGGVAFTNDSTGIRYISPGGYLSFERDNKRLRAEYDKKEKVYLEIYDNDHLIPNEQGKAFLAEAVKEMMERHVDNAN